MIWFLFKMIFRLATLGALVIGGYLIYAAVTGQKIDAAELSGVEKVEFEDGSFAQVKAATGWCSIDDLVGVSAQTPANLGFIYSKNCNDDREVGKSFLMISAFEFSAEHACKGQKQNSYQLNAPAGDANSCIINEEEMPSGYAVSINYPISQTKSLNFIADAQLWKDNYQQILDMIKTTKYVGAAK